MIVTPWYTKETVMRPSRLRMRERAAPQWHAVKSTARGPKSALCSRPWIGDKAYRSSRVDTELAKRGLEMIARHHRTRTTDPKWQNASRLSPPLACRTLVRVAPKLSARGHSLRPQAHNVLGFSKLTVCQF